MPNNAFLGQVYFLDGAATPDWLTYDTANNYWMGDYRGISSDPKMIEMYTHQSDFDFTEADGGSHKDRFANKIVNLVKTNGKITITTEAATYGQLIQYMTGAPVNIVLVAKDIGQGVYIHQVVPFFTKKTVAGKVQISEMSFEYEQTARPVPTDARYRPFELNYTR